MKWYTDMNSQGKRFFWGWLLLLISNVLYQMVVREQQEQIIRLTERNNYWRG